MKYMAVINLTWKNNSWFYSQIKVCPRQAGWVVYEILVCSPDFSQSNVCFLDLLWLLASWFDLILVLTRFRLIVVRFGIFLTSKSVCLIILSLTSLGTVFVRFDFYSEIWLDPFLDLTWLWFLGHQFKLIVVRFGFVVDS